MNWVFSWDAQECAELARHHGFSCVQWGIIDPDEAKAKKAAEAFGEAEIEVVALAAYQNIISADPEVKAKSIDTITRFIEFSRYFPNSLGIATETGTKHPSDPWGFDPLNLEAPAWQEMLDVLRPLGEQAKAADTQLLIEGYIENVVRTPAEIKRVKADLDPAAFGFVMDPFNLLEEAQLTQQPAALADIFTSMQGATPIAHAKDVRYTAGKISTPRSGTGVFDFPAYFKLLDEQLPGAPLMLEHLEAHEVDETLDFLKTQYEHYLKSCN